MPRNYQEYKDYLRASQRHLMTCEYLVNCLQLPENATHKPLASPYKKSLLKNIYYLSGYIIETIVNYAIYETVNESKQTNKMVYVNELYEPSIGLIFSTDPRKTQRQANDNRRYLYVIAYHNFQDNIQALNILANSKFSHIQVIGGVNYPSNWTQIRTLFNNWNAQVRYLHNIPYSETQIIDFFNLSVNLYTEIRQNITT